MPQLVLLLHGFFMMRCGGTPDCVCAFISCILRCVVALETCQGAQETFLGTTTNCNICLRHHLYYVSKDVRIEHQQCRVSAVVSVENDIDTALTLVLFARLRLLHLHH
jgi:hypothetical protein